MGWPEKEAPFTELALGGPHGVGKISSARLLGFNGPLKWTQDASSLRVAMPPQRPSDHAIALKVEGA